MRNLSRSSRLGVRGDFGVFGDRMGCRAAGFVSFFVPFDVFAASIFSKESLDLSMRLDGVVGLGERKNPPGDRRFSSSRIGRLWNLPVGDLVGVRVPPLAGGTGEKVTVLRLSLIFPFFVPSLSPVTAASDARLLLASCPLESVSSSPPFSAVPSVLDAPPRAPFCRGGLRYVLNSITASFVEEEARPGDPHLPPRRETNPR